MGYVAIKGGEKAIDGAADALEALRGGGQPSGSDPLSLHAIEHQLRLLTSRIMSEGGLYHPQLAALAIKQMQGDTLEAGFALRAYRSTRPRLLETPPQDTGQMRLIRRISSAFKDIPGGQMLGPTHDYALRLMRFELAEESPEPFRQMASQFMQNAPREALPDSFPKVLDALRAEGLLPPKPEHRNPAFDITRDPLIFPVSRSAALATMARAETGSMLAIAYSNMRGYGDVHPTVAELRVGYLPVMLPHPVTGELTEAGEVLMTECEVIAMYEPDETATGKDAAPEFTLGYGACFGHNETKAISMAILDRALQKGMRDGPANASEDPEFVLMHIDGVDSMGFANHYKMPHYVTFQSDMDRLRSTRSKYQQCRQDQQEVNHESEL
ncbi:alpha-D-ribose 1-methylphosphonate 5-triphosphate synthase subunit PhnI [Marinobacter sp. LV10R520-4]|uniref:carbon-phosphorus lyase complex subunit PhnI n=1 Tax=Marinobacter sp. LV10R520-4 TaxID=1761796 RepID=UPI000BF541EF|nr:carbon-phosphorus lyase complex subunit PhnI [Marinobacter sp. LV10R520-4]PFG52373.1 alpha-D-ribose 1-methylphosphonate 5-triphosphate synthase subunit PhnI [Marinobacter sp. LV10R520-4]